MSDKITNLTVESAKQILIDSNVREQANVEIHDILAGILARFVGKKLSKHVETAVHVMFPDCNVSGGFGYSGFEIKIWGGSTGRDYNGMFHAWVCSVEEAQAFKLEYFEKHDTRNGASARVRIVKRANWVHTGSGLVAFVERVNAAKAALLSVRDSLTGDNACGVPSELEYSAKGMLKGIAETINF